MAPMSLAHFRAHIKAKETDKGGRRTPISIYRYRPDLRFAEAPEYCYGAVPLPDDERVDRDSVWIAPGGARDVDFSVWADAGSIMPRLAVGSEFELMEGLQPVGSGTITKIYRVDE